MSIIKSFSVGNGDLYYIKHATSNFTLIDCNLIDDNKKRFVDEIINDKVGKDITRFISTHPDEDHFHGLTYLDDKINILNFYCVKNKAIKEINTDDFIRYCSLRDSSKAFYISKGCKRKWMNEDGPDDNGKVIYGSGIQILWPILSNEEFQAELASVAEGGEPNNISPIIEYSLRDGITAIWMGDLEQVFMEKIIDSISLPKIDILFAPHHGRGSGKVPKQWLDQMNPSIVVIGEAPSKDLNYYKDFNTITQLSAGDITFECNSKKVHIYASNKSYKVNFLDNENMTTFNYYIGTLNLK